MYTHSTICTWMYYLYTANIKNWLIYVPANMTRFLSIYMYFIGWNTAHDICYISISHISYVIYLYHIYHVSEQNKNLNRTVIMKVIWTLNWPSSSALSKIMMLPALATAFQPRSIRCHPLLPVTARLTESDFLSSPGASLRSYALTAPHGDFQPPLTRQRGRLSGPTGRILTRKQRGN